MITILLPINRISPYLDETLNSIYKSQTDLFEKNNLISELLIVSNGVSKFEQEMIETLLNESNVLNSRIIHSTKMGISDALNLGIKLSSYEYLARIDDDDLMVPERLSTQLEFLESNPDIALVGSFAKVIDAYGVVCGEIRHPIESEEIADYLNFQNCFVHSSVMFRKIKIEKAGFYDSIFDGAEDYELWLRLKSVGKLSNLPRYLTEHRRHSGQSTYGKFSHQKKLLRKIFRKYNYQEDDKTLLGRIINLGYCESLVLISSARNKLASSSVFFPIAIIEIMLAICFSPIGAINIIAKILEHRIKNDMANYGIIK